MRLPMFSRCTRCFGRFTVRSCHAFAARASCPPAHALAPVASTAPMIRAEATLPIVIETSNVPIYLYAPKEEVEPQALAQLVKLAESPLPVGYVAAMPDVHLGKGVTIGTVFASSKYVCPNAVGVDIGCGMCAVPIKGLHREDLSQDQLKRIQELIKQRVPTGFNERKRSLPSARRVLDEISDVHPPSQYVAKAMTAAKVANQLGTLGGGNHFLEVLYDENERVWIMLHSGSRNIGNTTAQHYDKLAQAGMAKLGLKAMGGLNYMEIDSLEGQQYLQDMQWCQQYAYENRAAMRDVLAELVAEVTGAAPAMDEAVNIHHNFCRCERCRYVSPRDWQDPRTGEEVDRELYVTRKGATPAQEDQLGLIPGSMAAGSFVTRGRGNARSWNSCSHGAGRRMSRTRAKADILQRDFEAAMKGIVCDVDPRVRDEAPQAYKDLSEVMRNQESLVEVVHQLQPLINVKGY